MAAPHVAVAFACQWVLKICGFAACSVASCLRRVQISDGASCGVLRCGPVLLLYRRELEYSWDILIENLTDPCECCCVCLSTNVYAWLSTNPDP